MPMKKTVAVLTFVMLFIFTVSTGMVMAQEKDGAAPPKPPKADRMTPEEWEAYSTMMYDHHQKMAPVRDQLWAKQLEYEALAANPNSKPAEVKAVIDDMVKLKAQLRAEKNDFYNQAKAKGFKHGKWGHRGFGPGHFGPDDDGYGCGFGPGKGHWGGKGYGPGKGGRGHHGDHWRD